MTADLTPACCRDPANRDVRWERPDLLVCTCRVCGRRHFEVAADPVHLGVRTPSPEPKEYVEQGRTIVVRHSDGTLRERSIAPNRPERERVQARGDDGYIGNAAIVEAIEADRVVEAPNDRGMPFVWKQSDGVYRGTLLRHCAVVEAPTFSTAVEAVEWFERRYRQTY